jgi:HTH-type transcriptional regulator / antitoxin HigA
MAQRFESDLAIHPGQLLAEELEVREWTQKALAAAMRRPAGVISAIISGKKSITAETPVQLEEVLGTPATLCVAKQGQYDLLMARRKLQKSA